MDASSVVLRLLGALVLFRALGLPLARLAFPRLDATAYAVATTLGLVVSAHFTWLLCHAGMRLGAFSVGIGLGLTALASLLAGLALRRRGLALLPSWRKVALHHLAFAMAF